MKELNRDVLRTARRASDDAKKVVMLTPTQFEGILDLISDLVKETEMLKTNVENLLDRVNELEEHNKRTLNIQMEKPKAHYATSGEEKKFQTSEKPKHFISYT